jgi:hypothetical protein
VSELDGVQHRWESCLRLAARLGAGQLHRHSQPPNRSSKPPPNRSLTTPAGDAAAQGLLLPEPEVRQVWQQGAC